MTEKEAREIVANPATSTSREFRTAKGYLEAIEKAERILVEALDKIFRDDNPNLNERRLQRILTIDNSLAEWEKEK